MPDQARDVVDDESGPPHATTGHLLRRVFTAHAVRDGPQPGEFVMLDVLADEDAPSQRDLADQRREEERAEAVADRRGRARPSCRKRALPWPSSPTKFCMRWMPWFGWAVIRVSPW